MKIGIDASRYKTDKPTGVEWYSRNLLNKMIPKMGKYHNDEFVLYVQKETKFEPELPFNVRVKILKQKRLWTTIRLSLEMILKEKPDKLFVPSHVLPLCLPKDSIITIHDVAFRKDGLKNVYSLKDKILLEWSTRVAVKKAKKIIVPSFFTKSELIKEFQAEDKKIEVVYHGAPIVPEQFDRRFVKWKKEYIENTFKKWGLGLEDSFVLFIGRIETKKNLFKVLEAMKKFKNDFLNWKLVLAGKDGIGAMEIRTKVKELGMENDVIFTGYVNEEEKWVLLDMCKVLLFISSYEGFGLPILEGFSRGKAVITSNSTACAEIASDFAIKVNPEKVEEISVALKKLALDPIIGQKFKELGLKRVEDFSWEKSAEKTLDLLVGRI